MKHLSTATLTLTVLAGVALAGPPLICHTYSIGNDTSLPWGADKNSWNELVHHLSGGLLYGYEVPKPEWLTFERKRAYAPKPGRRASVRCEEVLERLLRGWKDRQIAKDLGISFHRTRNLVARVLKQNHAHGRKELIRLLRPKGSEELNHEEHEAHEGNAKTTEPQIPRLD